MNNLIIPVGGSSSRYPNMRPKWLLTHPNGNFMFIEAIKDLNLEYFDCVYLICIKATLEKYKCEKGIISQIKSLKNIKKFKLIVLDNLTRNQPETVYLGILKEQISGSICIKDCDNHFKFKADGTNFVTYTDLDDLLSVNAANKSYITKNRDNVITNIVEKQVISRHFCSGCYGFQDANTYKKYYEQLSKEDNLYISHIIYKMLIDKQKFVAIKCFEYVDWGTLKDWSDYRSLYATLFVDIDGVIVENSAEYFEPKWGKTSSLDKNVDYLNKLYESGKVQIVLVTTRKLHSMKITENQLHRIGLRYHRVLYDMLHAKRIVVNDYSSTNSYPSCIALNIKRDSNDLFDLLSPFIKNS